MSKYRNIKTELDGLKFDSAREAKRWFELKLLERAGEISHLKRQVVYELAPSVIIKNRKRPPLRYIADFVYLDKRKKLSIEDVKGVVTDAYRIKRHLMMVQGFEIIEI